MRCLCWDIYFCVCFVDAAARKHLPFIWKAHFWWALDRKRRSFSLSPSRTYRLCTFSSSLLLFIYLFFCKANETAKWHNVICLWCKSASTLLFFFLPWNKTSQLKNLFHVNRLSLFFLPYYADYCRNRLLPRSHDSFLLLFFHIFKNLFIYFFLSCASMLNCRWGEICVGGMCWCSHAEGRAERITSKQDMASHVFKRKTGAMGSGGAPTAQITLNCN